MAYQTYKSHLAEIARRHGLPTYPHEEGRAVTQAVHRPGPGWCAKLLEPGSVEGDKLPAERAVLAKVQDLLPAPRLLGSGVTETPPVRVYHLYEWIEGRPWKEVVPGVRDRDRLKLLKTVGAHLGKLHRLPTPGEGEVPEIPRGNYETWRSRNLPILESNLSLLVHRNELTNRQANDVRSAVEKARERLFQSEMAWVHGDFSGPNILVDDLSAEPKVAAIIDWGNVGIDPLEADYEMVLLNVLLPEPDDNARVRRYDRGHFREMCQALEEGYSTERGLGIDWEVMKAHSLVQWTKRCVNNHERNPSVSRALAASIRTAISFNF